MYMIFGSKKPAGFLLVCLLLFAAGSAFSQNPQSQFSQRLQRGVNLYRESRWGEAVTELRVAQAEAINTRQRSEALYWIALAELSASDYEAALRDMDELERTGGGRIVDIAYHRGRAYYYLGYYEEAVVLLNEYVLNTGQTEKARISASYYWIGESLFALGQTDRAKDFFQAIIDWYPESAKFEAASYRIALINQKKVETELLALLKWSHEEYLKTIEEYRSRERTYDQTLNAYQRQLADRDRADLESYRRQLAEAQDRIRTLEGLLGPAAAPEDNSLRGWAQQLRREMERDTTNIENSGRIP
jgi:tetratricopeptide (TPR) repeat protein